MLYWTLWLLFYLEKESIVEEQLHFRLQLTKAT